MPSFLDFFTNGIAQDVSFFDEGPRLPITRPTSTFSKSGSIDTSAIDAFRQGVEIRSIKHYDAGTVKIHAGEPGHVLRQTRFGMDRNFNHEPIFVEKEYFNPVVFLQLQEYKEQLFHNIITFPIITGDNDQHENFVSDGIIEPFAIRSRASFFSIDIPFESREVKGALLDGNTDSVFASDRVLTIDYFDQTSPIPYLDMVDMFMSQSLNGFFIEDKQLHSPFKDVHDDADFLQQHSFEAGIAAALDDMIPASDNYVPFNKVSSTSGWVYDNVAGVGTDSLAFGGMTY